MIDQYYMDGHKLMWHFDKVMKVKMGETVAPIYLEVSPVSYCNHKCNFCGKDFVQSPDHLLKIPEYSAFIKETGAAGLKSVMFAGEGEPLLHPQFRELVSSTKNSGIDVSITTNGSRASTELWEDVMPHLTWVRFSVNGASSETYSKVHSVTSKEFDRVCKNIGEAVSFRNSRALKTTIGVQFVLLEENKHEVRKLIEIFTDLKVDYISIKPFSRNPQMILTKDENYDEELILDIKKICEESNKPDLVTKIHYRSEAFDKKNSGEIKYPRCHALPYWGYMTAGGDFYTCPIHIGNEKFKAGNINSDPAEKILFGKSRTDSISFAKNELDVKNVCRVNCRMARVNEFLETLEREPEHVNFI